MYIEVNFADILLADGMDCVGFFMNFDERIPLFKFRVYGNDLGETYLQSLDDKEQLFNSLCEYLARSFHIEHGEHSSLYKEFLVWLKCSLPADDEEMRKLACWFYEINEDEFETAEKLREYFVELILTGELDAQEIWDYITDPPIPGEEREIEYEDEGDEYSNLNS